MHEVLTLQFGQKSNYLATHFWNTQESYFTYSGEEESIIDHDIHFRPGIGVDGTETFTPRTVIYDVRSEFGPLQKLNALYGVEEPDESQALWNKPAVIYRQTSIEKSAYQQSLEQGLEPDSFRPNSVRYWSDYNRVYFHPRSIIQLDEYGVSSATISSGNRSIGEALFRSTEKEQDILERDLRPLVEEADLMQAIQVISSMDDAWSGFAARYLDRIRDEYPKTSVVYWGLEESTIAMPREKRYTSSSNVAMSILEIAPETTLLIPLTTPETIPAYVKLEQNSNWHMSALLSVAMESVTLPTRLKGTNGNQESFDQLKTLLDTSGHQNIAKIQMSIREKDKISDFYNHTSSPKWDKSVKTTGKSSQHNYRDYNEAKLKPVPDPGIFDIDLFPTQTSERVTRNPIKKVHIFSQYESHRINSSCCDENSYLLSPRMEERSSAAGIPVVTKKTIPLPFPLLDSFPQIFDQSSPTKYLTPRTSLTVDSAIALRLKSLKYAASRVSAVDERETIVNRIAELAEAYEGNWESGSDEDDD